MPARDRRLKIMQAAEKLFTSRRFHEITLDEVTREAGVGKGTIYRYFRDKDDLFFQTAMSGFDELCDLLQGATSGRASFRARLLTACERIAAFFRRRRPLFRMMQSEECRLHYGRGELRRQWTAHREKMTVALASVVARGAMEGAVRADVDPKVLACLLLGMLRAHARELGDAAGGAANLPVVVDLFLEGAGGDGHAPRASQAVRPGRSAAGKEDP